MRPAGAKEKIHVKREFGVTLSTTLPNSNLAWPFPIKCTDWQTSTICNILCKWRCVDRDGEMFVGAREASIPTCASDKDGIIA